MSLLRSLANDEPINLPFEVILKSTPGAWGDYTTVYLLVGGVTVAHEEFNPENTHLSEAVKDVIAKWLEVT